MPSPEPKCFVREGHAINKYLKEKKKALIFTACTLENMCELQFTLLTPFFVDPCKKICVNQNFLRPIIE